jgi:sugar lactone lactonase YvrE
MTRHRQRVVDSLTFPESPRWHGGREAFYFVDIDAGQLLELKDGATRVLHTFNDWISGIAFDNADGFYVASVNERKILHVAGALDGDILVTELADLSSRVKFVINDMTRAANGDLFVGGVNYNAVASFQDPSLPQEPGCLIRITPDGTVFDVPGDVLFPNGIVITPESDRLLMADSFHRRIASWELHADGTPGEMTVWADLGDEIPDGMCLDAEGALWIASHEHAIRVLEGGEIVDEVALDAKVSACMLGGTDAKTLVITSAASVDRRVLHACRTGALYAVDVDIPGAGLPSLYN